MKVTVVSGAPNEEWVKYENEIIENFRKKDPNIELDIYKVREMNLKDCVGCFSCWVKTPGNCIFKDDMEGLLRNTLKSDHLVFFSPIIIGFMSSELKRVMDRTIVLAQPYFKSYKGEYHHVPRYEDKFEISYLFGSETEIDSRVKDIIGNNIDRYGKNFHREHIEKIFGGVEIGGKLVDKLISN